MTRLWCRRLPGLLLALFFVAVAAAPHHHVNDLEDLLLDQRSDSGTLIEPVGAAAASHAPGLIPTRVVQDIPCLACFTGDFVCAPTASFVWTAALTPLLLLPAMPPAATPDLPRADTSSRAPPRIS